MNLQDYLMSDEDKAKLIAKLEQDIGFEDESFEGEAINTVASNLTSNEGDNDDNDLF